MWHVQYITAGGAALILRYRTPEAAIEAACRMLDAGCDVFGIGTGSLDDTINRPEIKRIYEMWTLARPYDRRDPSYRADYAAGGDAVNRRWND
jgi:hypothetical protein